MKIAIENDGGGAVFLDDGDSIPQGFTESNTVSNWNKFWKHGDVDYKKARSEIAAIVATEGFSNLSIDEKEIASKWFVVSKSDRDTVHSQAEQENFGHEYHKESMDCRHSRITLAEAIVYSRLSPGDAVSVIADLKSEQLVEQYIRHGIEGTESGDPEALFDYIEGTTATKYASGAALPGLAHKGFTPDSGSLADLVSDVMAILKNGQI